MKDKNLATSTGKLAVLIQNDIKVEVPARSVVYVEHIAKTSLRDTYIGGPRNLTEGDVDIVDRTAIMTTNDNDFRKIWVVNNENYLFHDVNGTGYAYSETGGTHAIDSAEFVQNFDHGKFKLNNDGNGFDNTNELNKYGLETMHIFSRSGSDQKNDVEINGNYFTLDASKVPLTHSRSLNDVSSGFAKYEIQNISNSIINNASNKHMVCRNINMVGNTSNVSAAIGSGEGGEQGSIERQMMLTSGGLNGFRTISHGKTSKVLSTMDVQNCNVSNCLISLYADCGMNIDYTHVKNSWANGLYAHVTQPDVVVSVSNSVIEASGGAAIQVDDQEFGIPSGGTGTAITPKAVIDYASCTVENYVSGAEQYFKGYGMESLAIGLKSLINSGVKGLGMTIVKNVVSPTTGLESECINWVYFTKTDNIKAAETVSSDIETDFMFGENYVKLTENIDTTEVAGTNLKNALYVDQSGHVNSDGTVNGLVVLDAVALGSGGKIAPYYPENAVFDHSRSTEQYVIVNVRINPSNQGLAGVGQMFFYFGMDQAIGYIQGMVELFKA